MDEKQISNKGDKEQISNNVDEDLMMKFSVYEQKIQQVNKQIDAIENGVSELKNLKKDMDEMNNCEGKEIMAPVGRGIFVKAKIISNDLLVDVGDRKFIKKDVESTKKIIENQIGKLGKVGEELQNSLREIDYELNSLLDEEKV